MNQGKLVFSQLMAFLPLSTFRRCVAKHRGDHKVQDFTCMDQFLTMAFAQLTYRESLRDIEVNLRAQAKRLYHMGLRCKTVSRNTLSNANATRSWQIYADFAQHLIAMARPLYVKEPMAIDLDATVYAFDATTIDLCLSVYPWAPFRAHKAAIKLHTLLDLIMQNHQRLTLIRQSLRKTKPNPKRRKKRQNRLPSKINACNTAIGHDHRNQRSRSPEYAPLNNSFRSLIPTSAGIVKRGSRSPWLTQFPRIPREPRTYGINQSKSSPQPTWSNKLLRQHLRIFWR
jgi:hypothetical protein